MTTNGWVPNLHAKRGKRPHDEQARAAAAYPALLALMVEAVRWSQCRGLLQFEPHSAASGGQPGGGAGLWTSGAIGRAIFLSGLRTEQGVEVHARLVRCIQPATGTHPACSPHASSLQPHASSLQPHAYPACNPTHPRCAHRRRW